MSTSESLNAGLSSSRENVEELSHLQPGKQNINVTFPGTVLPQEDGMPFHKAKKIKICSEDTNDSKKCFWFDVFYQDEDFFFFFFLNTKQRKYQRSDMLKAAFPCMRLHVASSPCVFYPQLCGSVSGKD